MASENITFNEIPAGIKDPGIYSEYNLSNARKGLPSKVPSMVIVGQNISSGTLAQHTPKAIISEDEAILYAGAGSPVHLAAKAQPFPLLLAVSLPPFL